MYFWKQYHRKKEKVKLANYENVHLNNTNMSELEKATNDARYTQTHTPTLSYQNEFIYCSSFRKYFPLFLLLIFVFFVFFILFLSRIFSFVYHCFKNIVAMQIIRSLTHIPRQRVFFFFTVVFRNLCFLHYKGISVYFVVFPLHSVISYPVFLSFFFSFYFFFTNVYLCAFAHISIPPHVEPSE